MDLDFYKQKYNYHLATSVIQQYLDIKYQHIDCLLLFRMGDFYELFFEDAITASQILDIALTKRGKNNAEEIPMCGVPYHALENYLNKLLEASYKVAICDQLETPEVAREKRGYKAIVKRDVTRIITPGTIIEENLINATTPNYLVSVVIVKNKAALAYVDLSTAVIATTSLPTTDIVNELIKLAPKEILISESYREDKLTSNIRERVKCSISYQLDSFFAINRTKRTLLAFYKIADVSAIGAITELETSSLGSIIEYLSLTQKGNFTQLPIPQILNYHNFMMIDSATRRNLELVSNGYNNHNNTVLAVLDHTMSKQGSRLLYNFLSSPLISLIEIEFRLSIVNIFYKNLALANKIRTILKNIGDLERAVTKVVMQRSMPRDLLVIKEALSKGLEIKNALIQSYVMNIPTHIEELYNKLSGDSELYDLIDEAIELAPAINLSNGGVIKRSYHPKLNELYSLVDDNKTHIEKLKTHYQQITSIENLKIQHNNVLGLFIEITNKQNNKINNDIFIHRQTTVNTVRYTTQELQKLENDIVNAHTRAIALEQEIYQNVCNQIINKTKKLYSLSYSISHFDVFCNLAYIAHKNNYIKPEITENNDFTVHNGRHLVIEATHGQNSIKQDFVANDCKLNDQRIALITGPNMSGKSTYLRQNAIIVILAQIGSFVPASYAKIGIVDKLFSRIGSGDDLSKGHSTFMVEMLETSAILAQSTNKSLMILDEVGRGTSTYDGLAIAWAVLEHIHNVNKSRCLFATHYHELVSLEKLLLGLKNYTVEIQEKGNEILFLHRIISGYADKSYGVHVAQLVGLPKSVITRASEILQKLESNKLKKEKKVLKDESNNFDLFTPSEKKAETIIDANYTEIMNILDNTNPDNLSPKEALEILYKIKNIQTLN